MSTALQRFSSDNEHNYSRTRQTLDGFTFENLTRPEEFVTLDQAITQCNTMAGDDDNLLNRLIRSAQAKVELDAAILLGQRSLRIAIQHPKLCGPALEFPPACWPILYISTINYRDSAGTLVPLTGYQESLKSRPSKIGLLPNSVWPSVQCEYFDALSIDCVAGIAPNSLLPHCELAKQAALLLVGDGFLNREISENGGTAYDSLITNIKQYRY